MDTAALTDTRPPYFTRSQERKRDGDADEDKRVSKLVKAMLTHIESGEETEVDVDQVDDVRIHWILDEFAMLAKEKCGIKILQSYKEAVSDPVHGNSWRGAMGTETLQLLQNNSGKEVVLPEGANLVTCKWVYDIKTNIAGSFDHFKARLVARGFTQVKGEDYDQTFAPTVRMNILRLFLAMATKEDLERTQV
jgi:hypothetical protein